MLKTPAEYDGDTSPAKLADFFTKFLPASLLDVSAIICQRAVVDESGVIRTQGCVMDHKMVVVHETACVIPPRKSNQ
jgi:hypothetical protein